MDICYIKEASNIDEVLSSWQLKLPKLIKKIIFKLKQAFRIVKVRTEKNKKVYILPMLEEQNIKDKKFELLAEKLNKDFNALYGVNIVLSSYLSRQEVFTKCFKHLKMIDGTKIFNILLLELVGYICDKQGENMNEQNISILVNNDTGNIIQSILLLSENVKGITIVTNNINKFTDVGNQICDKLGMVVKVTNNKKKSLYKANIIVNMDFKEEDINRYTVNKDAVIINVYNKNVTYKKNFNGIIINSFETIFDKQDEQFFKTFNLYDSFDKVQLLETILCENTNFKNMRIKLNNSKIVIDKVIGNNGYITDLEFIRKNT